MKRIPEPNQEIECPGCDSTQLPVQGAGRGVH